MTHIKVRSYSNVCMQTVVRYQKWVDGCTVGSANIYVSFSESRFYDGLAADFTGVEDGSEAS